MDYVGQDVLNGMTYSRQFMKYPQLYGKPPLSSHIDMPPETLPTFRALPFIDRVRQDEDRPTHMYESLSDGTTQRHIHVFTLIRKQLQLQTADCIHPVPTATVPGPFGFNSLPGHLTLILPYLQGFTLHGSRRTG